MRKYLLMLIALTGLATLGAKLEFAVGHVWSYKSRPGEERSTLLIETIGDNPKLGRIYHISLFDIDMGGGPTNIALHLPHLPVSRHTLEISCTTLVRQSKPDPEYLRGYQEWKQAFDAGKAGIVTISIHDIFQAMQTATHQRATST